MLRPSRLGNKHPQLPAGNALSEHCPGKDLGAQIYDPDGTPQLGWGLAPGRSRKVFGGINQGVLDQLKKNTGEEQRDGRKMIITERRTSEEGTSNIFISF